MTDPYANNVFRNTPLQNLFHQRIPKGHPLMPSVDNPIRINWQHNTEKLSIILSAIVETDAQRTELDKLIQTLNTVAKKYLTLIPKTKPVTTPKPPAPKPTTTTHKK